VNYECAVELIGRDVLGLCRCCRSFVFATKL